MKKTTLLFVFMLFFFNFYAQKVQISGYVTDSETGERLIGAIVTDSTNNKAVATNNYGYFTITCNSNKKINLKASFVGYQTIKITINTQKDTTCNFNLQKGINISEIIISTNKMQINNTEMGTTNLSVSLAKQLPSIGDENDILKTIQMLPGVQSGTEGSSGFFVRGGGIDQNLILLDDVPLYYVNHLGGFVSTFNSDALNNVKLIKGNSPARYGGRLSSVLDIRMKDGNMKKLTGNFSVSLLSSKIMLEGPIKKDTSSFLISARGLYWGFAYAALSRMLFDGFMINYNFYDINTKYNRIINNKNRIYFSFYYGDDNFVSKIFTDNKNEKILFPTRWGNFLTAFRWNKTFNSKLFSNTTISYTRYRYKKSFEFSDNSTKDFLSHKYFTGINDLSAKYEMQYFTSKNLNFRIGTDWTYHVFNPGFFDEIKILNDSVLIDTTYGNPNINSQELNFYTEVTAKLGDRININLGCRSSNYFTNEKIFNLFEPRISANLKITKNTSLKASYSKNSQNIHLLTSSTVGMPVDLWMPATSIAVPENSTQYSVGIFKLFKNSLLFSTEIYYKNMKNLVSFKEGQSYYGAAQNWEQKIELNGIGISYGADVMLEKKSGKLTGWLSYSYNKTTRQFDNINNGKAYPFKYDRRHTFNVVASYKINDKINLSLSWIYGTGYPYSMAIGKFQYIEDDNYPNYQADLNNYIYIYPERNSFRMKSFHHLDLGINFSKQKKRGTRTWSISVYNAYNHQNPFYYYLDTDKKGEWHLYQQSLFPIIPSVSYSFKF